MSAHVSRRAVPRTPFTDLDLVRCGIAYAKWCAARSFNPGKQIVADAFVDVLPATIRHRPGKVTLEGVYARTYIANAHHIAGEFEACHHALEEIGFYGRDDREIMAAYAIATWLNERGIARRSDCAWTAEPQTTTAVQTRGDIWLRVSPQ